MLSLQRVCVPLNLDCNLHCRYCFRERERLDAVPGFTSEMIGYLNNLDSTKTEAVCAQGGEPLMHFERVKELFSYVPKNVHKKVMSNCTLLTQEMVDYFNDNDVELHASHDGAMTKFLRGVDILADDRICGLLRQVKLLRIFGVVTKYNNDVWANFFDSAKKFGSTDFFYDTNPVWDIPSQRDLVEGFDYGLWCDTFMQFRVSPFSHRIPWYGRKTLDIGKPKRAVGFSVLPNGRVCGMVNAYSDYGSIDDCFETCFWKLLESGDMDACKTCKYLEDCFFPPQQCSSEHVRKCRVMFLDRRNADGWGKVRKYVYGHLDEIKKKYGYMGE